MVISQMKLEGQIEILSMNVVIIFQDSFRYIRIEDYRPSRN